MRTKFPVLSARKFPEVLSVKVDDETKDLFRMVKSHGYDASAIFRENGRSGLADAKAYILAQKKTS